MVAQKYNFPITASGKVSQAFLERGMHDFASAVEYIRDVPYGRNTDKLNLLTVFTDGCATCSTKHGLLKFLADENASQHPPGPLQRGNPDVQLILCLFKMDGENTRSVKNILERTGLPYMPEAHNYLRVNGEILDVMKKNWSITMFPETILEEHEIMPEQITDYKVAYHKAFLQNWLNQHPEIKYNLEELFTIREECIKALY
ncbi:MAG: hypothetical protein JWQ38_975 [Flavipsychrobacter sp.]|nr:hypothetical protein [Flavipsychrobacter sp.]